MNYAIKACITPKIGLLMHLTFRDSQQWLNDNIKDLLKLGAVINRTKREIRFPNGAILILGYGNKEVDYDKYRGLEINFVIGSSNPILTNQIRP